MHQLDFPIAHMSHLLSSSRQQLDQFSWNSSILFLLAIINLHKNLSPSPTMLKGIIFGCFLELNRYRFFECHNCLTFSLGHFGWPYLEAYVFRRMGGDGIRLSMEVIMLRKWWLVGLNWEWLVEACGSKVWLLADIIENQRRNCVCARARLWAGQCVGGSP